MTKPNPYPIRDPIRLHIGAISIPWGWSHRLIERLLQLYSEARSNNYRTTPYAPAHIELTGQAGAEKAPAHL